MHVVCSKGPTRGVYTPTSPLTRAPTIHPSIDPDDILTALASFFLLFVSLLSFIHTLTHMEETYRAKLTRDPPQSSGEVHILPHPGNQENQGPQGNQGAHGTQGNNAGAGSTQPIPIHLPNIYVNPFPPPVQPLPPNQSQAPTQAPHRPAPAAVPAHVPEPAPINVPTHDHAHPRHAPGTSHRSIRIGPWKITKPHPLLWLCLALSILALVLEVPKGTLPTITGRHRALRVSFSLPSAPLPLPVFPAPAFFLGEEHRNRWTNPRRRRNCSTSA